ncbi:hypothetical protein [Burkholderia plantarii]|uniref:hypothetical protein n=1 Tax=Burkholderia plantarii TaxID=41899 RepID=UPI0018DD956E|nr:hypothetical protein [Burkholderia plantarii]MBI0330374.1 hypothetical protein [Burkholderia plantarii]
MSKRQLPHRRVSRIIARRMPNPHGFESPGEATSPADARRRSGSCSEPHRLSLTGYGNQGFIPLLERHAPTGFRACVVIARHPPIAVEPTAVESIAVEPIVVEPVPPRDLAFSKRDPVSSGGASTVKAVACPPRQPGHASLAAYCARPIFKAIAVRTRAFIAMMRRERRAPMNRNPCRPMPATSADPIGFKEMCW